MSATVKLFICNYGMDTAIAEGGFVCDSCIELGKWVNFAYGGGNKVILGGKLLDTLPIDRWIRACWVNEVEKRDAIYLADIKDLVWLVEARELKGIVYHLDTYATSLQVISRMALAAMNSLPDDWPVVIYRV
jgi:hypothetical protein